VTTPETAITEVDLKELTENKQTSKHNNIKSKLLVIVVGEEDRKNSLKLKTSCVGLQFCFSFPTV
jgi:hypothetical protein